MINEFSNQSGLILEIDYKYMSKEKVILDCGHDTSKNEIILVDLADKDNSYFFICKKCKKKYLEILVSDFRKKTKRIKNIGIANFDIGCSKCGDTVPLYNNQCYACLKKKNKHLFHIPIFE